MPDIEFLHPNYLYLLLLLIPVIVWYIYRHNENQADFHISTSEIIRKIDKGTLVYFRHIPFILRTIVFALVIVILARPQSTNRWENETVEGIDIMLALDVSGSMLARDFSPDRMEASKEVATSFISDRPNDRMGIVLFGGESFTQCPLTTDHAVLLNLLHDVGVGIVQDQSTAIGLGLANAVNRLKDSDARSRVVILVTDGENNAGSVGPVTAAEIAKAFGVRVYTIGVGTRGTAPYPYRDGFGNIFYRQVEVRIDEDILRQIAHMTDGEYFRATNNQKLKEIYQEIDKMEKTRVDVKQYSKRNEQFRIFAFFALFLLVIEIMVRNLIIKTLN